MLSLDCRRRSGTASVDGGTPRPGIAARFPLGARSGSSWEFGEEGRVATDASGCRFASGLTRKPRDERPPGRDSLGSGDAVADPRESRPGGLAHPRASYIPRVAAEFRVADPSESDERPPGCRRSGSSTPPDETPHRETAGRRTAPIRAGETAIAEQVDGTRMFSALKPLERTTRRMRHICQDRIRRPGVEKQAEDGQEHKDPGQERQRVTGIRAPYGKPTAIAAPETRK